MRKPTVILAAAIAALVPAAAAEAATTVSASNSSLNVTAAAGRQNKIGLGLSGAVYKVRDSGDAVAAGPGCVAVDLHTAVCGAAGLNRTFIDVGDLDDSVVKDAWSLGGTIDGGSGDDMISGGPANWGNSLHGGPGDDSLLGGADSEFIEGGPGADVVSGGPGEDAASFLDHQVAVSVTIDGFANDGAPGEGDDVRLDVERAYGGAGDDTLVGSPRDNRLGGSGGADRIAGGDGHDTLIGGAGADRMFGNGGDDRFEAGKYPEGADELNGAAGIDVADYDLRVAGIVVDLDGVADDGAPGEGDDVRPDVENIDGGRSDDVLTGNDLAVNRLSGGTGSDILSGLGRDDVLIGGIGADSLFGGFGNDLLEGVDQVAGNDALDGQVGTDRCNSDAGDAETACEL